MPLPSITPRPQVFRFGAVAYSCFVVSRCQTDVRAYVHMCEPDRAAENRCSSVLLDRLDDDPPSMPSSLHLFRSIDSSCLAHDGGTHTGTTASSICCFTISGFKKTPPCACVLLASVRTSRSRSPRTASRRPVASFSYEKSYRVVRYAVLSCSMNLLVSKSKGVDVDQITI